MKTIIAGSRGITDYSSVCNAVHLSGIQISEVVSGCARGVDILGERWALENGIPTAKFPVTNRQWNTIGKSAGILRNVKMAKYADALIALWDGKSPGTKHMIDCAKTHGLKVYVYTYVKPEVQMLPDWSD